jgi:hypothetical protein
MKMQYKETETNNIIIHHIKKKVVNLHTNSLCLSLILKVLKYLEKVLRLNWEVILKQ